MRQAETQQIFYGSAGPVNEAGKIHRGDPDNKVGQQDRVDVANELAPHLVGPNDLNILSFD